MIQGFCFVGIILFNWILIKSFVTFAPRYGFHDIPNDRSSHDYHVLRGGGFVFAVSWFLNSFFWGDLFSIFNLGLLLVFIIGIWDDIKQIKPTHRLAWQFVAITCFLCDWKDIHIGDMGWLLFVLVALTYLINVFNFMDGINGMLVFYCISIMISLLFVGNGLALTASNPVTWILGASIAFLLFNFRKKAIVFAGDVGSLTLAFIILSFLFNHDLMVLNLYDRWNQFMLSLCCVSVFLMDSFTTIIHRLFLGQNIFESHRLHMYQLITPRFISNHLVTSIIYGVFQFFIVMCSYHVTTSLIARLFLLSILALFFLLLRYLLLKSTMAVPGR